MALMKVPSGTNPPYDVNVIIEIPAYSDPVKYEVDKETGALFVDRFMGTAMQYPCNYGYVPHSLSEDGDPLDVLVIAPWRLIPGSVVRCRPVGMLKMTDDAGIDTKILAVPIDKLTPLYKNVHTFRDLPDSQLAQIAHFFEHYKDLEPGKWVKVEGWLGPEEAKQEISASIERYQQAKKKPHF
ncbi:MAG: inorganic diphosphatase [Methylohalobius sp.]|nr:inorganic diphosphatase [Methylohalobius sp.]